MSDLTDKLISDSYTGVIHSDGPIPASGVSKLYDGVGTETSLSLGKAGNGATVTGTLNVENVSITGTLTSGSLTVGTSGNGASLTGNLSVGGTITSTGALKSGNVTYPTSVTETNIFDLIYPIGTLYLSMVDTNPSTYWTGTNWQKVSEGRYLAGAGTSTETNAVTFTPGNNTGNFKETYNLGMVDHIHGVGAFDSDTIDNNANVFIQSWSLDSTKSVRWLPGDAGYFVVGSKTPQTFSNVSGIVTSSPLNPSTGLPIQETDTIDINPPSFAMYVWQRIG